MGVKWGELYFIYPSYYVICYYNVQCYAQHNCQPISQKLEIKKANKHIYKYTYNQRATYAW